MGSPLSSSGADLLLILYYEPGGDAPTLVGFILHSFDINGSSTEMRMLRRWDEMIAFLGDESPDIEVLREMPAHFAELLVQHGVPGFLEWLEETLSNAIRMKRICLPVICETMAKTADLISAQLLL